MDRYNNLELFLRGLKKKHGDMGKEFLYTEEPEGERRKVLHRVLSLGMDPVPISKAESYLYYMKDRAKGRLGEEDRKELEEYLKDVLGVGNAEVYSFSKRAYGMKIHQIIVDGGDYLLHMVRKCNKKCSTYVGVVTNLKIPQWVNVNRYTAVIKFKNGIGEPERVELPLEMDSDTLKKEVYYSVLGRVRRHLQGVEGEIKILEHADKGKNFFLLGIYTPSTAVSINRMKAVLEKIVGAYKGG